MEKAFEELKNIVAIHFGALGFLNPSENEQILKDRDKVLNALTELQAIKEAKPSEALEDLEFLGDLSVYHDTGNLFKLHFKEEFDTIKQALQKEQEQDQVINECIKLLSVDGENTKAKVKAMLEGLK